MKSQPELSHKEFDVWSLDWRWQQRAEDSRFLLPRDRDLSPEKRWTNITLRTGHLIGIARAGKRISRSVAKSGRRWAHRTYALSGAQCSVWLCYHMFRYLGSRNLADSTTRPCYVDQAGSASVYPVFQGLRGSCANNCNCYIRHHRPCAGRGPILLAFSWKENWRFVIQLRQTRLRKAPQKIFRQITAWLNPSPLWLGRGEVNKTFLVFDYLPLKLPIVGSFHS